MPEGGIANRISHYAHPLLPHLPPESKKREMENKLLSTRIVSPALFLVLVLGT